MEGKQAGGGEDELQKDAGIRSSWEDIPPQESRGRKEFGSCQSWAREHGTLGLNPAFAEPGLHFSPLN